MTDIEKLQKLKEWILADQHPYFTSAPKVAHLLSLRVSASVSNANSNTSGSSGEQERPLSSIPLAERLSSPKMAYPGVPHQNSIYNDQEPSNRQRERIRDDVSMNDVDHKENNEDVEMPDSRYRETTGPLLTPTRTEPPHPLAYTRPEDAERKVENFNDRQSPRNDARGYGGYGDHRGNGRYEPRGRFRGAGGYNNQGNRRFSLENREQTDQRYHDYNRDRDYDRKSEYTAGHPDGQGNNARSFGDSPSKFSRQSYEGRSGESTRAPIPSNSLPMDTSVDVKSEEDKNVVTMNPPEDAGVTAELETTLDAKMELPSASPTSAGNGPPLSAPESITTIPAEASPARSEIALGTGQEDRPGGNRSPRSISVGRRDFKNGRVASRDRDARPNFNNADRYHHQDTRPKADSYQKYPAASRPYERPLQPREDTRTFATRDPYYRPAYPPVDDRRFVPREGGYPDDPAYPPRRDNRPGEWDNKRREPDRPLDRPYERDRERDIRGPLISPNDPRGPRMSHIAAAPPRGYPERDGPRGLNARNAHDPYPPHPVAHEPRGYDREPYGAPPLPPGGSYLREAPRVRPRSLSPPARRDYRPDTRPPAKRPRGPDDSYGIPPPAPGM